MAIIGQVTAGGNSNIPVAATLYGSCSSAANSSTKSISCLSYDLSTPINGLTIVVFFDQGNTYKPTQQNDDYIELNIQNTGYLPVIFPDVSEYRWPAGSTVAFTFDDTLGWIVTSSTYGVIPKFENELNQLVPSSIADYAVIYDNETDVLETIKIDTVLSPSSSNIPTSSAISSYVSTQISSQLSSVMTYKGVKATVSALPSSGNTQGDVWHVTEDGGEYAWDGSQWQELGTYKEIFPQLEDEVRDLIPSGSTENQFIVFDYDQDELTVEPLEPVIVESVLTEESSNVPTSDAVATYIAAQSIPSADITAIINTYL